VGLDLVEFTIAVEDAFRLSIPDADAERLHSPGKLVEYLLERLARADHPACLDQRAFYALRRAGIAVLGKARDALRPSTRWDELIPKRQRRRFWHSLHHATGTSKWPNLVPLTGGFYRNVATLGGTARYLATYTPGAFKPERAAWTRREVEQVITRLMLEELGISQFRWDQHFVKDLGCN
jgi:hypothetical protein